MGFKKGISLEAYKHNLKIVFGWYYRLYRLLKIPATICIILIIILMMKEVFTILRNTTFTVTDIGILIKYLFYSYMLKNILAALGKIEGIKKQFEEIGVSHGNENGS